MVLGFFIDWVHADYYAGSYEDYYAGSYVGSYEDYYAGSYDLFFYKKKGV